MSHTGALRALGGKIFAVVRKSLNYDWESQRGLFRTKTVQTAQCGSNELSRQKLSNHHIMASSNHGLPLRLPVTLTHIETEVYASEIVSNCRPLDNRLMMGICSLRTQANGCESL